MIKGLRLYLLPVWTAVVFFAACFGVEMSFWLVVYREAGFVDSEAYRQVVERIHSVVIMSGAFLYGALRMWTFCPLFNAQYRLSLAATPWQPGKPLPKGPLFFVWQDLLVMSALVALEVGTGSLSWTGVPFAMALPYAGFFAYPAAMAGRRIVSYAILISLGVPFVLFENPFLHMASALGLYGIVAATFSRLMLSYINAATNEQEFKDREQKLREALRALDQNAGARRPQELRLPWPLNRLPEDQRYRPGFLDKLFLAFFPTWLIFLGGWLIWREDGDPIPDSGMINAGLIVLGVAVVVRFFSYAVGYRPPLSLLGRLGTGRIIIPGYDVIFVPMIAALIVFAAVVRGLPLTGVHAFILPLVAIFLSLLTLLYLGPSLKTWQLTGHHRLSPASVANQLIKRI